MLYKLTLIKKFELQECHLRVVRAYEFSKLRTFAEFIT